MSQQCQIALQVPKQGLSLCGLISKGRSNKLFTACHRSTDHTLSRTGVEHTPLSYPPATATRWIWAIRTLTPICHWLRGCFGGGSNSSGHTGRGWSTVSRKPLGREMRILADGRRPEPTQGGNRAGCRQHLIQGGPSCPFPHIALVGNTLDLEARARRTAEGVPSVQGALNPQVRTSLWLIVNEEAILGDPILAAQPSTWVQI